MKKITKEQYVQLVGLMCLAKQSTNELNNIEKAACAITGEEPNKGSHTSDEVYAARGEPNADALLERLGIVVEK